MATSDSGEQDDAAPKRAPRDESPTWFDDGERVVIAEADVSGVNQRFYEALEAGDINKMRSVWDRSEDVLCAHPGRSPIRGWDDVWASWVAILGSGGNPQVILTEEVVTIRGSVAWVTGIENMISDGQTGAAAAINIFHHVDGEWKMLAHHSGPVLG